MNNLFSIFDPVRIFNLSLNWRRRIIVTLLVLPSLFWVRKNQFSLVLRKVINYLHIEARLALGSIKRPGVTHILLALFVFICLNNLFGLIPYIFTSTRHLSFTLTFRLLIWLSVVISSVLKDLNATLAHLVPAGTPYPLMPLIVLIEIVRNIIRPITLSVRLAANIVAGHLLLTLIGNSARVNAPIIIVFLVLIALILIIVLERAVALIQSYVFSTLRRLYVADVNSKHLWNYNVSLLSKINSKP